MRSRSSVLIYIVLPIIWKVTLRVQIKVQIITILKRVGGWGGGWWGWLVGLLNFLQYQIGRGIYRALPWKLNCVSNCDRNGIHQLAISTWVGSTGRKEGERVNAHWELNPIHSGGEFELSLSLSLCLKTCQTWKIQRKSSLKIYFHAFLLNLEFLEVRLKMVTQDIQDYCTG